MSKCNNFFDLIINLIEEIFLLSFSVSFNYNRNSAPFILWCKPDLYHDSGYDYDVLQRSSVKRSACSDKTRHFYILEHVFYSLSEFDKSTRPIVYTSDFGGRTS